MDETKLQILKTAVEVHNKNKRWYQPKWHLTENFLFYSIYYNAFPNIFHLHRTIYGLSWSVFPKEHHALLKS